MSSGTINLGRSVRDFTKSDELAEYTNVEFQVDDDHSVYAKAVGNLVGDTALWTKYAGQSGDTASVSGNNITLASTSAVTNWRVRVYTNPAVFTYSQFVGRTVHLRFDVVGTGTGWRLYTGIEVVDKPDGGSRIDFKNHTTITQNGSYSFDDAVGTWFQSSKQSGYIAFSFYLYCEGAATVNVRNIQIYLDDDSETTLVAKCPFANHIMAQKVLNSLSGFHYKPYEATGARLDMATEIGDTVQIDGAGYGLYGQDINFGSECVSKIVAPSDQELEHEFPYVPSTERNFRREVATLRAEIDIRSGEIEAKVEQRVPSEYGNQNTFGWKLQSDKFTVYSNGQTVLKVTQGGAEITGKVVATSGTIGGCEIVNGKLTIPAANIGNISAEQITAGYLDVKRIKTGSITGLELCENAVGNFQLGSSAVQGYNISGGAVSTGKIADYAVSNAKICDSAVTMSKISGDVRSVIGSAAKLFGNSLGNGYSFPTMTNPVFYSQIRWSAPSVGGGGRSYILGLYDTKPSVGKYVIALPA